MYLLNIFLIGRTQEESQKKELIGTLMRQNMKVSFKLFPRSRRLRLTDRKEFVRSCKPMLSTSGYPPALLDRFVRETDRGSLAKSISLRPI